MRDDRERLADIAESIERIQRYARRGKKAFVRDELIQTWVVHHLEILGCAARGVSEQLKAEHAEIPWREIVGMRNVLAHDYFGIDVELVWATVNRDLPKLKKQVEAVFKTMRADD